jgi:hypothetical protein
MISRSMMVEFSDDATHNLRLHAADWGVPVPYDVEIRQILYMLSLEYVRRPHDIANGGSAGFNIYQLQQ